MICFAYNPTSWADGPIPGGMADCHIRPVTEHLPDDTYVLTDKPQPDAVNVLYTHLRTYGLTQDPGVHTVFAGHGIADKGWRNPNRVSRHGHILSTGPHWTTKYVEGGIDRDRVLEVGYPKLDPIFQGRIKSPWPKRTKPRALWAPTHGGGGEGNAWNRPAGGRPSASSHWQDQKIVPALEPFETIICPHPRHREDKRSTLSEYVGADVVIADGGSTIYEAWALGIPVVFPTWLTGRSNTRKSARKGGTTEGLVYDQKVGRHATGPNDLARLIEEAAADGITAAEVEFMEPILPTALRDGAAGRRFAEALTLIDKEHR